MPIYKSKNNTYEISSRYIDINGNHKRLRKSGFKTVKEAKDYERRFMLTKKETKSKVSLLSIYQELLEYKKIKTKETTIDVLTSITNKYILQTFKDKLISEITTKDIQKWQQKLLNHDFSENYYNSIHSVLSQMFNYAIKTGYINDNPLTKVGRIKKPNDLRKEKNFLTLEEFKEFMGVIKKLEDKTIFTLLYTTGMRKGEMLALTWKDINFNNSKVGRNIISNNISRIWLWNIII